MIDYICPKCGATGLVTPEYSAYLASHGQCVECDGRQSVVAKGRLLTFLMPVLLEQKQALIDQRQRALEEIRARPIEDFAQSCGLNFEPQHPQWVSALTLVASRTVGHTVTRVHMHHHPSKADGVWQVLVSFGRNPAICSTEFYVTHEDILRAFGAV